MLTVGWKKALLTWSVIYTGRWSLKPPRKIGQSSHSDLVYFGKVCQGSKGSIHSQSFWSYDFFQAWNSISFTFTPTKGRPRPRRSSQLISSLSESHTMLSLCLWWSRHVNLLLLNICPLATTTKSHTWWNGQWAAPKSWKWAKCTFLEVKCLRFRGGSESEVAGGKMQLYIGCHL